MTTAIPEDHEIELPSIDDTTLFTDEEDVQVDQVNFELRQDLKIQGDYRVITVFNHRHCHLAFKTRNNRKFKYRIDLASLDPRPFRKRQIAWQWFYLSILIIVAGFYLFYEGWLSTTSSYVVTSMLGVFMLALIALSAFYQYSVDSVYFRSEHGKLKTIELANQNPDKASFNQFVKKLIKQIKQAKLAAGLTEVEALKLELGELRRLTDEAILKQPAYDQAKRIIQKKQGFKIRK